MKKIRLKNIALALAISIPTLWLALFWFLRNPVFTAGENTTVQIQVDPALLEKHVRFLAEMQPNRSFENLESLKKAETYIVDQFKEMGFTEIELQDVHANNQIYHNVIARLGDQKSKDLIVVGAHYDVATKENPGADDNASGVAGLLELARLFKTQNPALNQPVEFVAYTLEEPPFFDEPQMGSVFHADRLKEQGRNVTLMLSLEMIGYYSDKLFSQGFTMPLLYGFYPWTGNFIGLVGSPAYRSQQAEIKTVMIANCNVPVLSITAPAALPGIYFSDHNSYWKHGWPAFMITDTAFLRNHEYHKSGDTPDRLNYKNMAEVIRGTYAALLKHTST